jgi:hypothetical protein
MQEEKSRTNVTPTKEDAERDATSKETASDLKESGEAAAGSEPSSGSNSGSSPTPSPDGQFDSPRDGAGPGDEAGPM